MTLFEDLPSTALLSRDMVYTPGLMQLFYLLPGFEGLLGSRLALGLLQVGTALVCTNFVTDLESQHGKPVLAVNTATYWLALRQHGIADRLDGYGILLKDH